MSTPSYSELVAAVRREGESLLAAARLGLDVWVPTCAQWNVEALVEHTAKVWLYAGTLVSTHATEPPEQRPQPPEGEPLVVVESVLDDLVEALTDADADTPVWNWAEGEPRVAAFWARRMAHESSVHRFDAQIAHAMAQPIDAELAADGLDELVDVIAPRVYSRDDVTKGPTGTVAMESSDDEPRYVGLEPSTLARIGIVSAPDVTVRGTASALLLACYGRTPWSSLDVTGDQTLLQQWSAALSF